VIGGVVRFKIELPMKAFLAAKAQAHGTGFLIGNKGGLTDLAGVQPPFLLMKFVATCCLRFKFADDLFCFANPDFAFGNRSGRRALMAAILPSSSTRRALNWRAVTPKRP